MVVEATNGKMKGCMRGRDGRGQGFEGQHVLWSWESSLCSGVDPRYLSRLSELSGFSPYSTSIIEVKPSARRLLLTTPFCPPTVFVNMPPVDSTLHQLLPLTQSLHHSQDL